MHAQERLTAAVGEARGRGWAVEDAGVLLPPRAGHRLAAAAVSQSFLRVDWVAVPEAVRARRANRASWLPLVCALLRSGVPTLSTCPNLIVDGAGECAVRGYAGALIIIRNG
jgi:hypothetical protein